MSKKEEEFVVMSQDLAGFDICGWRHLNGAIQIGEQTNKRFIKDWPEAVYHNGNIFTLEEVKRGIVDSEGAIYECAIYA